MTQITAGLDEQLNVLKRGAVDLISEPDLRAKLQSGRQLRVKLGPLQKEFTLKPGDFGTKWVLFIVALAGTMTITCMQSVSETADVFIQGCQGGATKALIETSSSP